MQPAAPSRPARQPGPTARLLPSKQARPQRPEAPAGIPPHRELLQPLWQRSMATIPPQPRGSPPTASCCSRCGYDQWQRSVATIDDDENNGDNNVDDVDNNDDDENNDDDDNHEKGENRLSCLTMMIIVMMMRMVRTTRLMVSLLPASIKSSVWLTSVASNWNCSSSYK